MFGLNSNIHYQAIQTCKEPVILLKIEYEKLMNIVCTDFSTFSHLHKISLEKFRFMKKIMNAQIGPTNSEKVHLYDILNFMSNIYGRKNEQIAQFYENIQIDSLKAEI